MKRLFAIKYFLIIFFFAGMSCEEITVDKALKLGNDSTFQINKEYTSDNGQYTLKITEIGDSRCPEGVVCVWQGEVTVKGEWNENGNKSSFELHTVLNDQQKQPVGYNIQIIDAQPYPKYGTDSKPEDLVITLRIEKK